MACAVTLGPEAVAAAIMPDECWQFRHHFDEIIVTSSITKARQKIRSPIVKEETGESVAFNLTTADTFQNAAMNNVLTDAERRAHDKATGRIIGGLAALFGAA